MVPLSEIEDVVSSVPVLTPDLYRLVRRVADRAAGSAADILRLAIPKRMVRAEKVWLASETPEAPRIDETVREMVPRTPATSPGRAMTRACRPITTTNGV